MRTFEEANLASAKQTYAVANTPLFLIRKLREDSAVLEISSSFEGSAIIEALKEVLEHNPQTPEEYVRPYVYLVALAQKPQNVFLRQALSLAGHEKWDWYEYVAAVLLETYMATQFQRVTPQNALQSYVSGIAGTDAETYVTIR
jgi:hypothetical protein